MQKKTALKKGTVITNNGDAVAMPTLRLVGPLTNPLVQNGANNGFMQVNYAIPDGSFVTVDMLEHTILLNDSSSILSTKGDTSDWFGLEPGENPISLNTDDAGDTGYAELTAYGSFLGV